MGAIASQITSLTIVYILYPWALSVSRPAVNLVEIKGVVRHGQQFSGVRVKSVYV